MKKFKDIFTRDKKVNSFERETKVENIDENSILNKKLDNNINKIKDVLGNSSDIEIRRFTVGKNKDIKLAIIIIDGIVKKELVYDFVLKSLMVDLRDIDLNRDVNLVDTLKKCTVPDGEMDKIQDFKTLFMRLLSGDTIILLDGHSIGFTTGTRGWKDRGVTEPSSQNVVRGPKDSFCETLRTNTALIRRRIKNTNLWIENKRIGKETNTDIAIMYIKGIVSEDILEEVHRRLDKIDIDAILEGGYIEEFIQDETFTVFPTVYNTERPDSVAAGLLEGRVAILVDGTPYVLLVPTLFVQYFQSPEDYYQRADIASLLRLLRYVAFFLALLTPSIYIAITTFHHEMIPTTLLISIAAQREGIPFPAFVEAFIMEFTFEILREAGLRMPKAIGPAISIVGALVLGEAAVQAGIVSPVMVIVVSMTAISSFIFPSYNLAISVRIIRFLFMILAASFGLYGIALGLLTMLLHLCSLRSFGIPYMSPMAPFSIQGQKDTVVRFPLWSMFKRPKLISQKDIVRQKSSSIVTSKKSKDKK